MLKRGPGMAWISAMPASRYQALSAYILKQDCRYRQEGLVIRHGLETVLKASIA